MTQMDSKLHLCMRNAHRKLQAHCFFGIPIILLLNFVFASVAAAQSPSSAYRELGGLQYRVVVTAGADAEARLPMLIALHYMSGSPETSYQDYADLDTPSRVLLMAGAYPYKGGHSWFPAGYYELDAGSRAEIAVDTAKTLAQFIDLVLTKYPTSGRPIVTGYSQGGDLSHILALRHSELISAALPMGGLFPDGWRQGLDSDGARSPEMHIFHGGADPIVPFGEAFAAAQYYTANGANVIVRSYAGVGHDYPSEMKQDYQQTVEHLLRRTASHD